MKTFLKKLHTPTWLFILLLLVLILRIPSFFEPYSYGDQMIYLTLGEAVRRGIPLYSAIHDNKPPLLYIMAALAGSLFWFKAILAVWNLITIFLFWKLSETLFPKQGKLQKVATVIFALLTTLPLLEGNIVNAELFMVGPIIAAYLILFSRKLNFRNIFAGGILFGLATLFKVPAAFDLPAIIFLWFVTNKLSRKTLKEFVLNTIYLVAGFLAPIAVTIIWYAGRGALTEYLSAAFLQNVGYLSSWRPGEIAQPFLTRNFPLLVRGVTVAFGLTILFLKRKKLSKNFVFLTTWLIFTLFAVTLSERPYPHYLIQSIAPVSFLFAILLTQKSIEQVLVIVPLAITALVPVYFRFWYYPTAPYYLRFIRFATGTISRDVYISSFDNKTLTKYKVASFVASSTMTSDKIFVWGDDSAIYALSRRFPPGKYITDYHIKDFSSETETIGILKKDMPEFVVVFPDASPFPQLAVFLRANYAIAETINGAEIWRLLNPRVRALIAP